MSFTYCDPTSWDIYFIKLAELISTKSKDPSTKVGAVIVGADNEILSTGFNGFPRGVDESIPSRWERPDKYKWIVHAEANAVANAARIGVSLKNTVMYMNFQPQPCTGCAAIVSQAGIITIKGPDRVFSGVGKHVHYDVDDIANEMMHEVNMNRIVIRNS